MVTASDIAPRWPAPRSPGSKAEALDAMDLYEQAIRSAQANYFTHNEALAHELAVLSYLERASDLAQFGLGLLPIFVRYL